MGRFINPFTDYGFKKIFGQEISKDLLIDFLNDLLAGERVITDLTFLNNEQLPQYDEGRGLIYDIYCSTDTGEKIIVEMQNKSQTNFKERALYYLSNAIVQQAKPGTQWKFSVKAVYGVFFMNFLFAENVKFRTDVILSDRETGELFSDRMRQIFIALPLFNKEENECETDFERWIYTLKNMETLKRMPFKARKAVFEKLEDIVDVASLSKEEQERYQNSVNVYRTNLCVLDAAEKEGIEKGRAEGKAEGRAEGKAEERLNNARRMKEAGIACTLISQITGLSSEEIAAL
jgi:predicted transposase/invertase (TIGR01784 family)